MAHVEIYSSFPVACIIIVYNTVIQGSRSVVLTILQAATLGFGLQAVEQGALKSAFSLEITWSTNQWNGRVDTRVMALVPCLKGSGGVNICKIIVPLK